MKFRIKHVEGIGYFTQVKTWLGWRKIGRHISSYGLYSSKSIDYPLASIEDAITRRDNYLINRPTKKDITYTELKEL